MKKRIEVDTRYPRFSIVITTYKRPLSCLKLLITLYGQAHTRSEEHQIIIVNDGSHDDEQYGQIDHYVSRLPGDHLYLPLHREQGDTPRVYGVKNYAIRSARNEIIWLLDDDITFDSHSLFILQLNWMIFRHAHPLMSPYLSNYNWPSHQQEPFSIHAQTSDVEKMKVYPTFAGMSFLKEDWEAVGGIDERYDGSMGFADLDFALMMHEYGCNVMQVPGFTIHVDDRETGSHRVRILEGTPDPHPNAVKFVRKWGPDTAKLYLSNHEAVDRIAALIAQEKVA